MFFEIEINKSLIKKAYAHSLRHSSQARTVTETKTQLKRSPHITVLAYEDCQRTKTLKKHWSPSLEHTKLHSENNETKEKGKTSGNERERSEKGEEERRVKKTGAMSFFVSFPLSFPSSFFHLNCMRQRCIELTCTICESTKNRTIFLLLAIYFTIWLVLGPDSIRIARFEPWIVRF